MFRANVQQQKASQDIEKKKYFPYFTSLADSFKAQEAKIRLRPVQEPKG